MFLSPEEIEALTGYRRWGAQRRWLSEHGYRHDTDAQVQAVAQACQQRGKTVHMFSGLVSYAECR
jgi:hypothetical protein